ncbi:AEC family transporter [Reyranella aquatilis]|uniref:AEC family transporter n=1 Tax=Reyranella aquatilis TaxID=2035356 RepID=A0ABS8KT14_9HYPH|nr:AEC family transporter [Reyranella aquatilis]MCC8429219.1 AEC family transporter [Reyranella aquatilis]
MSAEVILALVPIVLLILLGMGLRHLRFLAEGFWSQAERLSYYVLVPCLFFHSLATARLDALPARALVTTLILSILAVAALLVALRPMLRVDGPTFTSIFQGGIRFNNYVGVTLAAGLFGSQGIALAALCSAAIVPTVNILCVLVFARHGSARLSGRGIARQLVTNPLVLGSFAGIGFQFLGLGLPAGIEPALRALGAASLPLGLLCVGAALEFGSVRGWMAPVATSSAIKFLALPVMTMLVASLMGLTGPALVTALLFQALPTASSAYIMARQLGGDAPLMAGITALQTLFALVALPIAAAGIGALAA